MIAAAVKLVRAGRPPSIPDAAAEALVSVPTAYRYFTSADDLWSEASWQAVDFDGYFAELERRIDAAGPDVLSRAEVAAGVVRRMLEDQVPFRQLAKAALERWFAQRREGGGDRVPVRAGRRNEINRLVVAPLRGALPRRKLERLVRALGLVSGTDAMLALADTLGLDTEEAMVTLLDATRWMLAGALAEARVDGKAGPRSRDA